MSTGIALAGPADADRLLDLMARHHADAGLGHDDLHRATVAGPLLDGSPLGAVWLIGPRGSPLGYVMITFGWSMAQGGMVGWLEECYIRPSVRARGIGTEVLHTVALNLGQAGVRALHVLLPPWADDAAARFCTRAGFRAVPDARLMTDTL